MTTMHCASRHLASTRSSIFRNFCVCTQNHLMSILFTGLRTPSRKTGSLEWAWLILTGIASKSTQNCCGHLWARPKESLSRKCWSSSIKKLSIWSKCLRLWITVWTRCRIIWECCSSIITNMTRCWLVIGNSIWLKIEGAGLVKTRSCSSAIILISWIGLSPKKRQRWFWSILGSSWSIRTFWGCWDAWLMRFIRGKRQSLRRRNSSGFWSSSNWIVHWRCRNRSPILTTGCTWKTTRGF